MWNKDEEHSGAVSAVKLYKKTRLAYHPHRQTLRGWQGDWMIELQNKSTGSYGPSWQCLPGSCGSRRALWQGRRPSRA